MTDNEKLYALVLIWLPVGIVITTVGVLFWAMSTALDSLARGL